MGKDQYEFKNKLCKCIHPRDYHNGIKGYCYVHGCKCTKFVELVGVS